MRKNNFFLVNECLLSFSTNIARCDLRSECENLLKISCKKLNLDFDVVRRDKHGKPYILNQKFYFSFSHSQDIACCVVNKERSVGVDIQFIDEKLLHVKEKFLNPNDFGYNEENLDLLCKLWCIKEAVFKAAPQHLVGLKDIKIKNLDAAEDKNGFFYDLFCSRFEKLHFALAINL